MTLVCLLWRLLFSAPGVPLRVHTQRSPALTKQMVCRVTLYDMESISNWRQYSVVTNDQVPPLQGLQSTSSETLTVSATLSQSPSPSILFPSLRRHRDSMSSVSTSSTAVDGEELNAPSQKPMFPSFKIDNRNTVGAIITSRLLKNDHTRLQQSIMFYEEPETYSVPSVSHKLDSLQHCSDAFSLAMLQQRHNYINVGPPSISKTLLSKVPNPWFRPRTSHLLPI